MIQIKIFLPCHLYFFTIGYLLVFVGVLDGCFITFLYKKIQNNTKKSGYIEAQFKLNWQINSDRIFKRVNKMIEKQNRDLVLVTEWNKYFSYPTLSLLRKLIFNAETNGFKKVVRRIGRRVYIKVDAFFEWIDEQNGFTTNYGGTKNA